MGIFNPTEEEKNLKKLSRTIRYSNSLRYEWLDTLATYVDKVAANERDNDLVNIDYLNRFMLKMLEWTNINDENPSEMFRKILNVLHTLIPAKEKTENFHMIMEMFINNYCGNNNFIDYDLIDSSFYAIFGSKFNYLEVMNIIIDDIKLRDNFDTIVSFAVSVSPYCANETVLKNEVLSFASELKDEYGEVSELLARRVEEAKKRCGVYPLDEKELARISEEARKAESLIAKLDRIRMNVEGFQRKIDSATDIGKKDLATELKRIKKEITELGDTTVSKMETLNTEARQAIIEELDKYVRSLEETLQRKTDQIFNKILEDTSLRISELRRAAELVSTNTTTELLRIQGVSEETISRLKKYVEDEPTVQRLLKGVEEDNELKNAILSLKASGALDSQKKEETVSVPEAPSVIIPGYERLVSPANPSVILPEGKIDRTIIPAFDESIPFDKRMDRILKIKAARQAEGEIFHDMTDEIIRCVLEGDWVYLWGPSGCGKSYSIKQVASLIGLDMVDNGKITDKYSIMAYNDPQGRFRATQAFVSILYGKMLSLDEFDNGNPDTQVVLNELYSALLDTLERPNQLRYVTFAEDMRVPVHPNFRMISAGNTSGEGENQAFSSRGKIDESVQQRMTPKRFWYDNRVEKQIFKDYTAWYNIFVNFRKACDEYAIRQGMDTPIGVVTTRDASAIVKYINHNSKNIDQVLAEKFVQTKSPDYLKFIVSEFRKMYDLNSEDTRTRNITKLADAKEVDIAKRLIRCCNSDTRSA